MVPKSGFWDTLYVDKTSITAIVNSDAPKPVRVEDLRPYTSMLDSMFLHIFYNELLQLTSHEEQYHVQLEEKKVKDGCVWTHNNLN